MSDLKPFRQYDEHDVINLFTFNGTSGTNGVLLQAGKLVDIHTGWKADDDQVDLSTSASGTANGMDLSGKVLSNTWGLNAKVQATDVGDTAIGMTLVAMRDEDENGEKLLYNPRKAAEMGVVIPGQAIPLATKGLFIIKSDNAAGWTNVTITAGATLYAGPSGEVTNSSGSSAKAIGVALGGKDANGYALVKLDL
jgi:hypothetical protein